MDDCRGRGGPRGRPRPGRHPVFPCPAPALGRGLCAGIAAGWRRRGGRVVRLGRPIYGQGRVTGGLSAARDRLPHRGNRTARPTARRVRRVQGHARAVAQEPVRDQCGPARSRRGRAEAHPRAWCRGRAVAARRNQGDLPRRCGDHAGLGDPAGSSGIGHTGQCGGGRLPGRSGRAQPPGSPGPAGRTTADGGPEGD